MHRFLKHLRVYLDLALYAHKVYRTESPDHNSEITEEGQRYKGVVFRGVISVPTVDSENASSIRSRTSAFMETPY